MRELPCSEERVLSACERTGSSQHSAFRENRKDSFAESGLLMAESSSDYERLANEVIEVKRMLTSFIQKLTADG